MEMMNNRNDSESFTESRFETLLAKHRLSFNWGGTKKVWWLIGQEKGSNRLLRTEPVPADDIDSARLAAYRHILELYQK